MDVIDLFAGCGGMSLGFQQAGHNIVLAVENWDKALECYTENFNHQALSHDLTQVNDTVNLLTPYEFDLIIGGPPCQDFSHAGSRVEGLNANLTVAFAEIVCALHPPCFVFENVDRAQKSESYRKAKAVFTVAGYTLTEVVLNASRCGVPQNRKRFFAIGTTHNPEGQLEVLIENGLDEHPMTIRQYLGNALGIEYYYRHPRNYNRRGIFSVDEPSPTIRGVNRPIPAGYSLHHGDPVQSLDGVRPLTTRERAILQTFPADFILTGSKTNQEQMIGNAVPVNMASYLARCIDLHYQNIQRGVEE
ncbi:MAG: DNA cytosine methyltransferase [Pseudodesulfovibrio sp.]|nr:DNA cytosine methyltransferase [Pseudodesulfovibrio sp.]